MGIRIGLNTILVCFATLVPCALGREKYMTLVTIAAGTAANWMNMFLPSFVILWMQVLPKRSRGEPWICDALQTAWILTLATACAVSSILQALFEALGISPQATCLTHMHV